MAQGSDSQLFNFTQNQGSNQYGSYPSISLPTSNLTGTNGVQSTPGVSAQQGSGDYNYATGTGADPNLISGNTPITYTRGNTSITSTQDPALTTALGNYLQSQVGQGVTPFNESAVLPSSGQATTAGTLTAPTNQMIQQLQQAFQTGNFSSIPGLSTVAQVSQSGDAIDQTPAWQAMVNSMQNNIQQNQAQLKESMNVGGNLVGSPYGTALSNYQAQTASTENSQLVSAQTAALQQSAQNQLTAGTSLAGIQGNLAQYLQGLDQQSITNLYNEFIRTSPQNNPLISAETAVGTTYPSTGGKVPSTVGAIISGFESGGLAGAAAGGLNASSAQ
jgi:hypothetical protein